MIWVLLAGLIFSLLCFAVYPVLMIVLYKLRYGRRVSVKWILKEIGW